MVAQGAIQLAGMMLQGTRQALASVVAFPFRLKFIFLWFVGVLFLLFNASAFYGPDAGAETMRLTLYLTALAFVFSQTRRGNPLAGMSTAEFVTVFTLWTVLGAALFKWLAPFNPEVAVLTTASLAILVTHALVVAIGEELLFRFALPNLIPGPAMAAQALSALVFGIMHWAAYGGNIAGLAFAAVLGLLFGAITVRFRHGLVIAMALHFVWNSYTLGYI